MSVTEASSLTVRLDVISFVSPLYTRSSSQSLFYTGCPLCSHTPNSSWLGTGWIAYPAAWHTVILSDHSSYLTRSAWQNPAFRPLGASVPAKLKTEGLLDQSLTYFYQT